MPLPLVKVAISPSLLVAHFSIPNSVNLSFGIPKSPELGKPKIYPLTSTLRKELFTN